MGILGTLFGESKSKSNSDNQSYGFLKDSLGGVVSGVGNSFNALNNELAGGFDAYKKKSGFNAALGEGLTGISGSRAALGGLRSGDTGREALRFGDALSSQRYDNYLTNLRGNTEAGLGAAGILAGAGQRSTSTAKDNGKGLVGGLTSIFSDRRLKKDITRIGTADNGLPIYAYSYINDPHDTTHIGFMADEVKDLHPEAVSTDLMGYQMVDYGKAVL